MAKKPVETDLVDVMDDDIILEDDLELEQIAAKSLKNNKADKTKRKGGSPVIPVIILLIVVGGVASMFVFNILGVRDVTAEYLSGAPLVGDFFPGPSEETGEDGGRYASMPAEAVEAEMIAKDSEIERLQAALQEAETQKTEDDETIAYLREFERQIMSYREVKARFDQMVVDGATPEAYITFFESISPENQEALYQDSLNEAEYNKELREQTATFVEMDEAAAADALEEMLGPNSALVIAVLSEMAPEDRAGIFDEMDASLVSRISNLLEPAEPEDVPIEVAPPLPEGLPEPTGEPLTGEGAAAPAGTPAEGDAVTAGQ